MEINYKGGISMSLINCPECNKEISDKAVNCPHCGNPINEQKPIIVRKDYKAKAKAFTIAGVIVFLISGFIGISSAGSMVRMKARYLSGGGGAYPILNFGITALTWIGIILIVVGIIYWIINASNKDK